ncbi:hypothetical protein PMAYCL1PPCAC_07247, partial [Pristionchus mayeri]
VLSSFSHLDVFSLVRPFPVSSPSFPFHSSSSSFPLLSVTPLSTLRSSPSSLLNESISDGTLNVVSVDFRNMSTIAPFSPSTSFDYPTIKHTWNRNEEVYRILEAAVIHREWLSGSALQRPASGTQLLFSRSHVDFKNDGYEWTRRKDGRLIREDHMKLKVKKMDVIHANYAHSAIVPTFHRRAYSLISNPDIVLVHYLKSEENDDTGATPLCARISDSIRKNGLRPTLPDLIEQMEPILQCMTKSDIQFIAQEVMGNLRQEAETKLIMESPFSIGNDLFVVESGSSGSSIEYLLVPSSGALNRRNSCSSASRRGLSSLILTRQPSAFSDSVETQFISGAVKREWNERNNDHLYQREGVHSRSHSGDTAHSSDEMATDWSRIDTVNGHPPSCSDWSTFNSEWSVNRGPSTSIGSSNLTICPSIASAKGGDRVLIVGSWFSRGHEYSVMFGDKRVRAILIQDGVIQALTPPGKGRICVRVLSDETPLGPPLDFFYKSHAREGLSRLHLLQALVDRVHLLCTAFDFRVSMDNFDRDGIMSVVDSLRGRSPVFPYLLNSTIPSRTILHLAAALDFHELLQRLIFRRDDFPAKYREFDINAKDMEGETPLTIALADRKGRCAMILANEAGWSMEDLDRETERLRSENMGGTIIDVDDITCHREDDYSMSDGPARSTKAWVMSLGEPMIEMREGIRGDEIGQRVPLEISMDTEVLVPDSPTMANLFQAVTSPGLVNDFARDQMATLTRRLIDALPPNVKNQNGVTDVHHAHSHFLFANGTSMVPDVSMSSGNVDYQLNANMELTYGQYDSQYDGQIPPTHEIYAHFNSEYFPPTSSIDHISSIGELDVELEDKDLGEFLSGSSEISEGIDPLQKKLESLKLKPTEQREVYDAAMLMQSSALGGVPPTEEERIAATTIQSCYRRYKQYCYLRRLHNAAVVVQKHFRLRRANQKEETHDEVQEHPSMQEESICIQVPNRSLSREHRAAATIQNAYRVHRKRQGAAKVIQKFMRTSATRQKLRKMHEASDGVCTGDGTTGREERR